MRNFKILLFIAVVWLSACHSEQKKVNQQDTVAEETDTIANSPTVADAQSATNDNPNSTTNPNGILVTCDAVGKINIGDTYVDVIKKAGKANVELDSVFVKGVFQNTYVTKVWKGTAGEITINWQESAQPYQTIQNIIIDRPGSTYVTENGIKLGAKLSLLVKLNGKAVSLIGFAGQNAGTLMNFNGGNLINQIPCVRAVFALPTMKSYPKEVNAILHSSLVQSNHIAFKIYDPILVKLIINSKR